MLLAEDKTWPLFRSLIIDRVDLGVSYETLILLPIRVELCDRFFRFSIVGLHISCTTQKQVQKEYRIQRSQRVILTDPLQLLL